MIKITDKVLGKKDINLELIKLNIPIKKSKKNYKDEIL
jgi:hypothetical protein